jgi:hypothetical protein
MLIWSVTASENEPREDTFASHLQLKRGIKPNNSEDVLGTSSFKHGRCKISFLTVKERFTPSARQLLQQLLIEIEWNISKPEQIRFVLLWEAGYSFRAPILTDVRDGRNPHIVPSNCCPGMLHFPPTIPFPGDPSSDCHSVCQS